MSETVKLIIEIPKRDYEEIKKVGVFTFPHVSKAIREATLLDSVKAEIREQQKEYQEWGWAYDDVLEILDNIVKGVSE